MLSSVGILRLYGSHYSRNRYLDRLTRESIDSRTFGSAATEWAPSDAEEISTLDIYGITDYSRSRVINSLGASDESA